MARKIRIDPHIHSEGSDDSTESVRDIVEHVNEIDIDAAVITDHDTIKNSLEAVELSKSYDNAKFIPGVEVSTRDGHLLAIGVRECPEKDKPFMETVQKIREMGGIAAVPHPFQLSRHGVPKKKIDDCDAIEIFNSSWVLSGLQNRRAKSFAKRNGHAGIAGSDAHQIKLIGQAYTEIEVEKRLLRRSLKESDIIGAMKGGYSSVEGKRAGVKNTFSNYVHYSRRKAGKRTSQAQSAVAAVLSGIF